MIASLRKRIEREDEGFTLIELMVVVLIIAILLAIAIPTFLGARERAQDRAAQSNVRNAFTAEKVFYTDNQAYSATPASMQAIETSVSFKNSGTLSATGNQVFIETATVGTTANGAVCLTAKSASGRYYVLKDISTGASAGTTYDQATTDPTGSCDATPLTGKW
jgi:type IV pilus assembly protein PilA